MGSSFKILKTSFYCTSLVFLFSGILSPQPINKELDNYLSTFFNNKNIPSVAAGVAQNGTIIWLDSRGYADMENLIPASSKTVYRIASISKSITAVAIMQLVEEGKVNLDADVRTYIPYFPKKKWKFTPRQLLSHTSGIRDYKSGEFNNTSYFNSTGEIVKYLAKDSLMFEPGTKYLYSTLAYNLLAAIVENVSRLSFSDYLKKRIFEPAGMTSSLLDFQQEIIFNRARGYVKSFDRKIKNAPLADLSIKYAGGGVVSTSEDLLKFAISLMEGKLISSSSLDSMLVPTKLKNGTTRDYGLGFDARVDETGRRYFQHAGGGTGFSSLLVIYPNEKTAAVHLLNIRDRGIDDAAIDLALIAMNLQPPLPKKSFADYLVSVYNLSGLDSTVTEYKNWKFTDTSVYKINEDEFILFGYDLISMNRQMDAIKYFRNVVSDHPSNSRAFVGLADAYHKDKNIGMAINSYRRALRIDPLNSYAEKMLLKLNGN
ncbi:MAG: serine hydrolase [Ignavibacteriaceae bacterium]